eukprot:gnl/Spiro4/26927_TR13394_c0_g1_i1.p1 gnl/Spiro4/26927_TR13394_c0_g1~~gnl/Spiro4/26927_TR13394_c0_g1_i1.p1  ORF type:complete len:212 (+),score=38.70 gnl/Spiro4/26927_TR13394_c0_g1_i1:51-686(+)
MSEVLQDSLPGHHGSYNTKGQMEHGHGTGPRWEGHWLANSDVQSRPGLPRGLADGHLGMARKTPTNLKKDPIVECWANYCERLNMKSIPRWWVWCAAAGVTISYVVFARITIADYDFSRQARGIPPRVSWADIGFNFAKPWAYPYHARKSKYFDQANMAAARGYTYDNRMAPYPPELRALAYKTPEKMAKVDRLLARSPRNHGPASSPSHH